MPQAYHKYYPLGIIYLAKVLRDNKHEVVVRDYFYNQKKANLEFYNLVRDFKPDIVGFSMLTMNRVSSYEMAKKARGIDKDIKIITGGPHASYMYRQLLEEFDFDIVSIGESEDTLVELAERIESDLPISDVKGIAFKDGNNIYLTDRRSFINDIDRLPIPCHTDFKDKIHASKEAYILTSRGCPIGCMYCSTSHFWGKLWRARSAENVVNEIEYLVRTFPSLENIMFHDDAFTMDKKRTVDICKKILERNIKIRWNCQTRVDSLNEEVASWMKKAGCRHVYLGAESGSQRIIDRIGKKISVKGIRETSRTLEKVGIPYGIYLMVGNPGESEDSINETIRLLNEVSPTNFNRPSILQIYPGTEIYAKAKEENFISDRYWLTNNKTPLYTRESTLEQLNLWSNRIALHLRKNKGLFLSVGSIIKYIFTHPLSQTVITVRQVIEDIRRKSKLSKA